MAQGTCPIIENGIRCNRPITIRGWCHKHYQRWRLRGDPLIVKKGGVARTDDGVRAWWHVEKTDTCWLWTGYLDRSGYGVFFSVPDATNYRQVAVPAHRFIFQLTYGAVPDRYHLHHECRVRNCVNPEHVTPLLPRDHEAAHRTPTCGKCGDNNWAYGRSRNTGERTARSCRTCRNTHARLKRKAGG